MPLSRGPLRNRRIAAAIFALTFVVCGAIFTREMRQGRTQRHIDAGIAFAEHGQAGEAEREWRIAAQATPNSVALWELLSELYINTEQWKKGSEALLHVQRLAPNTPFVYSKLAACALRSGEELEARRFAQEELERRPNDPASLHILAFLSDMQGDRDRKLEYLQRLLNHDPKDPEILRDLIEAYNKSERYAEVLPLVDRLLSVRPGDGFALATRGAARYETDASPSASAQSEADLIQALQQLPLTAFARYNLGRVYAREGQFQKAIFQLELAQKLNPGRMDIPFALAAAYARAGQPAKAEATRNRFETLRRQATRISELQKQCSLEKNNFAVHLELGQRLFQQGDYRQASYYLQRALVLKPEDSAARQAFQQLTARLKGTSQ